MAGKFSPQEVAERKAAMHVDAQRRGRPFRRLPPDAVPKDAGPLALLALAVSAALAIAGVVWILMASGPVMEAGGSVASGGPYVIEHQAEDWIWLPTVGATVMMFAFVANFFLAASLDRPAGVSALVFWTAVFGPMSFQFFKYGISAPGGGVSWAWIVCGVLFAVFAIPSALLLFVPSTWRGFSGAYAWANAIGLVGGLGGALWVWRIVAG
jgi:hypothetical protein